MKQATWHGDSFVRFVSETLPAVIGERLPLESYKATVKDGICRIKLVLGGEAGRGKLDMEVPAPKEDGFFEIDGKPYFCVPQASSEDLEQAEIRCVGEQLLEFIAPQIAEAPADLAWNDEVAASCLPLDKWVAEFLSGQADPSEGFCGVVRSYAPNFFAAYEETHRIITDSVRGEQEVVTRSQIGRVCPIMMPEGPNIGMIVHLARGAEIRDGRIVVTNDDPAMAFALTTSCIPLLQHDDVNRALMGANIMRQWRNPPTAEPALVQTGVEPDEPGVWCGRNLLTAFVSWGEDTYEDGIVVSESAAERLSYEAPLEPGDKLSNRHGTKGVVARILPDAAMPHLRDGTPVELVFGSAGLHTRMNFGQLKEAVLGRLAHIEGDPVVLPPLTGPTDEEIRTQLQAAGLPENGMEVLRKGADGEPLERPSTVGYVYWGLTWHVAREKLHSYPDYPGNKQGELEYYILRDLGAEASIHEVFNLRSENRAGVEALADAIAAGECPAGDAATPAWQKLQQHLLAAGIRAELDAGQVRFSVCEPEGDALELACPVPHPWLAGQTLNRVGRVERSSCWAPLEETNSRTERMLEGEVPESLADRMRTSLAVRLAAYLEDLVSPAVLRPGGRVAFSGRAVIAPGSGLGWDQVGLPDTMAWNLFGPLATRELGDAKAVQERTHAAAEALDRVMERAWVIAWRAPAVRPVSMLAFRPVRVPERVIRLPLPVNALLNADFDGDQLAVSLPITEAGQTEAAEKFSVAAHLARDPALLRLLVPRQDALWGLAELSRSEEGAQQIAGIAGADARGELGFVTAASLGSVLAPVLAAEAPEKVLRICRELFQLGIRVATNSGASFCPLAGKTAEPASAPDLHDTEAYLAWADDVRDSILARTDYDAIDLGPQLLYVKSGARGNVVQLQNATTGTVIADMDRRLYFVKNGYIRGHSPEEIFMWRIGALRGLGEVAFRFYSIEQDLRKERQTRGFNVLSRAMRSRCPGRVFARAAAAGEVDELRDIDARLFVGLQA